MLELHHSVLVFENLVVMETSIKIQTFYMHCSLFVAFSTLFGEEWSTPDYNFHAFGWLLAL